MKKLILLTPEEKELIEKHRNGAKAIWWSIEDFESVAKDIEDDEEEENMFDRSKFPLALEKMIDMHDATEGITWETVRFFLENYCTK